MNFRATINRIKLLSTRCCIRCVSFRIRNRQIKKWAEYFFLRQCTCLTSIEVVYYDGQCGCHQCYPPRVSLIPYSDITTTIYSFLGRPYTFTTLVCYQNTMDTTRSVTPIIIIRVKIFPIITDAASLISFVFSLASFW